MIRNPLSIIPCLMLAAFSLHCGSSEPRTGTSAAGAGSEVSEGGAGPASPGGRGAASPSAGVGGAISDAGGTSGSLGGGAGSDGSGAGAAGSAGSSGASGGGGATASATCPTGAFFCDDFESYTTGAAPNGKWTVQVRGGAKAEVDTTMAFSGTKSVHFTGTVNQASANIIAKSAPVFPIQGNKLFLRMMMYIKSYPATSGTHSRFMRIGTNTNGLDGTSYALDTYNGIGIEHVNSGMFRNTSLHLGDDAFTAKWVCWEWALDNTAGPPPGDTGTVMAYLWHDGAAINLTKTSDKLPWDPISWQLLEIGLEAYQADTQAGDFWIDDVALNASRIGCPSN
jgi:hypothetical protein